MTALKLNQKIDNTLLNKIKSLLEEEGIEGDFWIVKDKEVKNRYNIIIRAKNIKTTEKRIKKEIDIEKKIGSLIPDRHFLVIIHPA
ncbi:MAG: hypothetical protein GXO21_05650 [Aquificae bacterium]|nr:hypothetical protein [Aquificota bacterium]